MGAGNQMEGREHPENPSLHQTRTFARQDETSHRITTCKLHRPLRKQPNHSRKETNSDQRDGKQRTTIGEKEGERRTIYSDFRIIQIMDEKISKNPKKIHKKTQKMRCLSK